MSVLENPISLQSRLRKLKKTSSLRRITDALEACDHDSPTRSFLISATDALNLWTVRHENARMTGLQIPGAPNLLKNLKALPANSLVEQYGVPGVEAGVVFFDQDTGRLLGDTIRVLRKPPSSDSQSDRYSSSKKVR